MVFQFKEKRPSRQHKKGEFELQYTSQGSSESTFVRAFARQYAPQIVTTAEGNLYQQDVEVIPRSKWIMDVRVPYGPVQKVAGSYNWGAQCTAGTVHIQAGISHVARFPANAIDRKGLINVDGQEVNGADIVIPVSQRWVDFTQPLGAFTWAMADRLDNLVACVNSKPFMQKKAGEVLMLGYSGEDGSNKEATVRLDFAISKNRRGFQIADIAGITKDGHDLIWMSYTANGGGAAPGRKVVAAYVERVYERVDLAAELGFGG
jgi:hypothetical protein